MSKIFGCKTREKAAVLDLLAVDNFDFTRKIVKNILGEKLVKMLGSCIFKNITVGIRKSDSHSFCLESILDHFPAFIKGRTGFRIDTVRFFVWNILHFS